VTTPARERIVTTGLADEIAFRLQAAILDGQYAPGMHLSQEDLCERFGVSRTPIREALRKLQAQNLIELVPNKGARIRVPSRSELEDVYTVRSGLEGFACQLAAERMTDPLLARIRSLQEAIDREVELLERGMVEGEDEAAFNSRMTRANGNFHDAIYRAAQNDRLRSMIDDLLNYFPKDYVWRATRRGRDASALAVEDHRRIIDALEARDGDAARRAMAEHILHSGRLLLDYLDAHEFWSKTEK
jgi:DNA-binding GntR family transcriptional regulator